MVVTPRVFDSWVEARQFPVSGQHKHSQALVRLSAFSLRDRLKYRRWSSPLTAQRADNSYEISFGELQIVAYLWIALGALLVAALGIFSAVTSPSSFHLAFPTERC
jgi:hypothetical protein